MTRQSLPLQSLPGFTLIEMAVVLVIVGLLLGGMLLPLSTQLDLEGNRKTTAELAEIKEALLGFAAINGRLPCPADSTTNGLEVAQNANGTCTLYQGFLPASTLGITPTDSQGFAIDYWGNGNINRIRYALSSVDSPIANATGSITDYHFNSQISLSLSPSDLKVCASGTGITGTGCGTSASLTSGNTVVAVIYSLGKNASTGGTSTDEAANLNGDSVFVSHDTTSDFDDQLVWISFPVLANRMITAGKLP